jgi:fucose permease
MTVLVGAAASGWRWGFGVLAAAQAVVAVLCVAGRPGWVSSPPAPRAAGARRLTATSWWALAVFMLYVGFEVGAGQWAFTLFTEGRGMSDAVAGVAVTAFYAALTAARFLLGGFGHRVSVTGISTASVVLAFVAALVLWWAPVPWLGVLALVVCGFALGPIFPLQMTLTPQRTGAGGTASMVGYQIGAASLGAFVVPGLIGLLVEPWGVSVIAPVLVLVGAALVATDLVLRRMPTTETEPVAI